MLSHGSKSRLRKLEVNVGDGGGTRFDGQLGSQVAKMYRVDEHTAIDRAAFEANLETLRNALDLVVDPPVTDPLALDALPAQIPIEGIGPDAALELVAQIALPQGSSLRAPMAASRMASPTPWLTWAAAVWSAARSENLLHKADTPQVNALQDRVIDWLAPLWGMTTGHLVPGGTIANLTAMWAARDGAGVTRIVTSEASSTSIKKVSRVLGMPLILLDSEPDERLSMDSLVDFARRDGDGMGRTAVVLNAGTHNTGAIDPLRDAMKSLHNIGLEPAWWHVDASWAGPMALSSRHRALLHGIESADSITVSAHKMMFQPTESALVMFRDAQKSDAVLEFAGPDGTTQIGLLGSRADRSLAIALLLLAYGEQGIASWLDAGIGAMMTVADFLRARDDVEVFNSPTTGVLLWRPLKRDTDDVLNDLGRQVAGLGVADGRRWIRQVGSNPIMDVEELTGRIATVLELPNV
jgi:L-2,4-diaminobutyrate decarboxylase